MGVSVGLLDMYAEARQNAIRHQTGWPKQQEALNEQEPFTSFAATWTEILEGRWFPAVVRAAACTIYTHGPAMAMCAVVIQNTAIQALLRTMDMSHGDGVGVYVDLVEMGAIMGTPVYNHGTCGLHILKDEDINSWIGQVLAVRLSVVQSRRLWLQVNDICRITDIPRSLKRQAERLVPAPRPE